MLSRRDILTATVAAGAGLAMASQASELAKAQPARRVIVDAQVLEQALILEYPLR
jgi:TAT (twin-arginine translocation) pathway signal sequence